MIRRSLGSIFSAISNLFRSQKSKHPTKRSQLQLQPLEERVVPAILYQGQTWENGYWNGSYYENTTIWVTNSSLNPIYVSGGGNNVSVSKATPIYK